MGPEEPNQRLWGRGIQFKPFEEKEENLKGIAVGS